MDQTTFIARPQHERCQAGISPQCTGEREVRLTCRTEGADLSICNPCHVSWRSYNYPDRCPRCFSWTGVDARTSAPSTYEPLTGPVAKAMDVAMHAEGLLSDVRDRVLRRLAHNAPWLAEMPGPILDASGFALTEDGLYEFRKQWHGVMANPDRTQVIRP